MEKNLKDLLQYFLITYGFSWVVWSPFILHSRGIIEIPSFLLPMFGPIGTFGPFVAAFFLTYKDDGGNGVVTLLKRGFNWKFNKIWWVPILLFWPMLQGVSLLFAVLFGKEALPAFSEIMLFSQPWLLILIFFRTVFIGGPIGEEFGWRGYALDRLQAKWNALVSCLILALFHACWHFPLWLVQGPKARNTPFLIFIVIILTLTIVWVWLYNNTNHSVLPAIVTHAFSNMIIFPFPETKLGYPIYLLLFILSAIIIVIIFKPKKLVRE
jgi:uncharacterized protein